MTERERVAQAVRRAREMLADLSLRAAADEPDSEEAARHMDVVRALFGIQGAVVSET